MAKVFDYEGLWGLLRDCVAREYPSLRNADMRMLVTKNGLVHGLVIAEPGENLDELDDRGRPILTPTAAPTPAAASEPQASDAVPEAIVDQEPATVLAAPTAK